MNKYKFILLLLVYFASGSSFAQEVAITVQTPSSRQIYSKKQTKSSLTLPFFDDFSQGINTSLWHNSGVSQDLSSSVNPPSIGTAMFDAMDNNGNFYALRRDVITPSDTLESLPINLNYPTDNSIYLSFVYQPKGRLDAPEYNDSLVLQFYDPTTDKWSTQWKAFGENPDIATFKTVIINIQGSYLQDGFKFRFINYTSLNGYVPSLISDCDFWFIDYVFLDKNRYAGDTTFNDIALSYPSVFKIDDYTAMPAEHYKNFYTELNHSYSLTIRNNANQFNTIDSLYIVFREKSGLVSPDTLYLGSYSFPQNNTFYLKNQNINFSLPVNSQTGLDFETITKMVTNANDPEQNNVSTGSYSLQNYYAYDDGSSEMGYGLVGEGTYEALVAAKFYTYKPDNLAAVSIYFNKTYDDNQPRYFYLMVWDNDPQSGKPAQVLYQEQGVEIDFNNRNSFQTFYLKTPVTVSDTFYIGWMKTDEQLMNVGLDITTPTAQYKYYNLNGQWVKSSITGNLMIRPVFGETLSNIENTDNTLKIYPNPAKDFIKIANHSHGKYTIFDLTGHVIKQGSLTTGQTIDLYNLPQGLYIIQLIDNNTVYVAKFVKN